ncbi:MAG: ABC transporter permease, partial [Candidatus Saccharimonadales bacterium]
TDFKLRYQNSAIGYLWSLLKPLFLFAILYTVFTQILRIGADIPGYPVYLLTGILIWSFFQETTATSVTSIVSKGSLIRKINIPKYLIVVASALSSLINLGLSLIVLALFIAFTVNTTVTWSLVLFVPLLIIQLFILATSIAFIVSAMYVKFRDISYIWDLLLRAGFYVTPILYPLQIVPEMVQKLLLLNPAAQIIQDLRRILVLPNDTIQIYDVFSWPMYLVPFVITVLIAIFAIYYFKKQAIDFAENV